MSRTPQNGRGMAMERIRGVRLLLAVSVVLAGLLGAEMVAAQNSDPVPGDGGGGAGGGQPGPASTTTTRRGTTTTTAAPATTTTAAQGAAQGVAQVSDATVRPGQQVTVTGDGFAPNQELRMTFFSHPRALGATRSDATGRFNAAIQIPADAEAGAHRIVVEGPAPQGGSRQSVGSVTAELARTGTNELPLVILGMAALVLGARVVRYAQWTRPVSTSGSIPRRRWWPQGPLNRRAEGSRRR